MPNQMIMLRSCKPNSYIPAVTRLQSIPPPKTTRPRFTGWRPSVTQIPEIKRNNTEPQCITKVNTAG